HIGNLLAILIIAGFCTIPAEAQEASDVESLKRQELETLRRSIGQAARRSTTLAREKETLRREAEAISTRLVELAGRLQAREALIIRNEKRIRELEEKESSLLALLAMNRSAIAELLAALQKLRRDPPPPFVTRPDDVLAAVRGALLLSSAVPQVDARVARLLGSISRLRRVREGLKKEQEEKRRNIEQLRRTRRQIDELLAGKRELIRRIDVRLEEEQKRLKRLTDKARTLNEVMAALRREERRRRELERRKRAEKVRRAKAEAAREKAKKEKPGKEKTAPPTMASVPKPSRPFTSLKGRLPWPVQGERLLGYGEKLGLGGRSEGIYVATRPGASVVAPADARVELARPFRSYGQLLILDPGRGYRILLAGLKKTTVETGQYVRAGEPVGEMGSRPAPATVTDSQLETRRPILYMELRKNGRPIDATRWWLGARQEARRK
ncbi:MAG TPA: hypothetical protein ENJ62_01425, partial [Bryobacterales bacterium]|nr:hypothetical protein [Bryobacterales bacterium]